jgi:hypothetical protein
MSTEINDYERYFEWWLKELKDVGLVLSYEREPEPFILRSNLPIYYHQHYATKGPIVKNWNLFNPITYTADYRVIFSFKLASKLFGIVSKKDKTLYDLDYKKPGSVYQETLFYSVVEIRDKGFISEGVEVWFDVKPPAKAIQFSGKLGSSREFPYNQRLVYEEYDKIVNKVVPIGVSTCLFAKTFLPERYLYTDKSGAPRKLKPYEQKAKTLKQYLELKQIEL